MNQDIVYLQDRLEDTQFYPYIPLDQTLKHRWYQEWWAAHIGKPAHVILEKGHTIHLQFEGETVAYAVSRGYLKESP